jgi:hypothetical protein
MTVDDARAQEIDRCQEVIAQQALETVVDVRDLCIMGAASFGIVLILLLMQVVSHNKIVFHEKVGVLA